MVITDRSLSLGRTDLEICRQVLRGGATSLQIRLKDTDDREVVDLATEVAPLAEKAGALLVVNDRPDIARLAGAPACHLGPEDIGLEQARQVVGETVLLGYSAAYLGAGPVYATGTKADAGEPIGVDGLAAVARATFLPVIAIGGIGAGQVDACIRAGACGVAVISAAVGAPSVAPAVRGLRRAVDAALTAAGT